MDICTFLSIFSHTPKKFSVSSLRNTYFPGNMRWVEEKIGHNPLVSESSFNNLYNTNFYLLLFHSSTAFRLQILHLPSMMY